jgi:pyruvate dehydrogenase E2 component (dihydrolipoamide acetyltransferase)
MPALGMAQETGVLLQWLKQPGQAVIQGEPLMEIETDKATVEIEVPASGTLAHVTAQPGDVVPVGQVIALILAPGEAAPAPRPSSLTRAPSPVTASPVAARMAAEHNVSLDRIKPLGGRVEKQDVLNYLAGQAPAPPDAGRMGNSAKVLASPKARRLAQERGLDLAALLGSGPGGAVLTADVLGAHTSPNASDRQSQPVGVQPPTSDFRPLTSSRLWRRMAERVTQAWTTIPHFYLQREVNAARLAAWRAEAQARASEKITYTDLLLKLIAAALTRHPRVNATWQGDDLITHSAVNLGLAVAVDDGLIVPVIHNVARLGLGQIAARRAELVAKAQAGKLAPADLEGGTFTMSNLGMFGVDVFNALVNPPQVAILAVGAVADRVVPVDGQPAVRPMVTLSLSCDHRAVDGARAAEFLRTLADLIEAPLRVME